jgi:predicted nucleic acid-binding protein
VKVIDSSTLVKYLSREAGWEKTREIILEGVITLDLAIKEIINALWKKVSRNEMSFELALKIVKDLVEGKPFPIESQEQYLVEAFEISIKNKITIYDALFITFAKKRGLELITSDMKQADVARELGIKVVVT